MEACFFLGYHARVMQITSRAEQITRVSTSRRAITSPVSNIINLDIKWKSHPLTYFAFAFVSGESTVIWKEKGRIISAGDAIIRKDARLSLRGYNLRIDRLRETDAGEYVCEIETFGSPLAQSSTLEILGKVDLRLLDIGQVDTPRRWYRDGWWDRWMEWGRERKKEKFYHHQNRYK